MQSNQRIRRWILSALDSYGSFFGLSVYLSVFLSVFLFVFFLSFVVRSSLRLCVSFGLSFCLSVFLFSCVYFCLSGSLFPCVSFNKSFFLCFCPHDYLSSGLFAYLLIFIEYLSFSSFFCLTFRLSFFFSSRFIIKL